MTEEIATLQDFRCAGEHFGKKLAAQALAECDAMDSAGFQSHLQIEVLPKKAEELAAIGAGTDEINAFIQSFGAAFRQSLSASGDQRLLAAMDAATVDQAPGLNRHERRAWRKRRGVERLAIVD